MKKFLAGLVVCGIAIATGGCTQYGGVAPSDPEPRGTPPAPKPMTNPPTPGPSPSPTPSAPSAH